jgi:D-alanyl-lipoteichoic acid acyltransferase DltB (MBOAT superfamily)
MPSRFPLLRFLVLARDAVGYVYMILLRTLWFGASWMLIIWRFYAGLGVAGRAIARRVSTGRIRILSGEVRGG